MKQPGEFPGYYVYRFLPISLSTLNLPVFYVYNYFQITIKLHQIFFPIHKLLTVFLSVTSKLRVLFCLSQHWFETVTKSRLFSIQLTCINQAQLHTTASEIKEISFNHQILQHRSCDGKEIFKPQGRWIGTKKTSKYLWEIAQHQLMPVKTAVFKQ